MVEKDIEQILRSKINKRKENIKLWEKLMKENNMNELNNIEPRLKADEAEFERTLKEAIDKLGGARCEQIMEEMSGT